MDSVDPVRTTHMSRVHSRRYGVHPVDLHYTAIEGRGAKLAAVTVQYLAIPHVQNGDGLRVLLGQSFPHVNLTHSAITEVDIARAIPFQFIKQHAADARL